MTGYVKKKYYCCKAGREGIRFPTFGSLNHSIHVLHITVFLLLEFFFLSRGIEIHKCGLIYVIVGSLDLKKKNLRRAHVDLTFLFLWICDHYYSGFFFHHIHHEGSHHGEFLCAPKCKEHYIS